VPILRAGLGMVEGFTDLIPAAKIGFIGMYRDEETLKPHEYFVKLPSDVSERQLFVVDPMLATGGSAVDAIGALKKRGCEKRTSSLPAWLLLQKALRQSKPLIRMLTSTRQPWMNA
jgi:Uracil phosphoribosyltransferase